MSSFAEQIGRLRTYFINELQAASSTKDLEQLKLKYLGKKGSVQTLMQELRHCSFEERPHFGKLINDLKEEFIVHCENSFSRLKEEERAIAFEKEKIDATLPGRRSFLGRIHPINQMLQRITDILIGMGF